MSVNNFYMNFRSARNLIPKEVQIQIDTSKEDINDTFSVCLTDFGFSWAKISNRIIIWRHDVKLHQHEISFYELTIPPTFYTKHIFLHAFTRHSSKSVSVMMVSVLGDVRYWANAHLVSKFASCQLNLSSGTIIRLLPIDTDKYLLILNDYSQVFLETDSGQIKHNFVSVKSYVAKVISNIFSPFTRRAGSIEHDKINVISWPQNDKSYINILISNKREIKLFHIILTSLPFVQEEKILHIDNAMRRFEFQNNSMGRLQFLNIVYTKNSFLAFIEASNAESPTFEYYILTFIISQNCSFVPQDIKSMDDISIENAHDCLTCYSNTFDCVLFTINDRFYIFECSNGSISSVKPPSTDAPLAISFCELSNEFIIMFNGFKFSFLKIKSSDDSTNQSCRLLNSTRDIDISSIMEKEPLLLESQILPQTTFERVDMAYKKYFNQQKDLAISLISCGLDSLSLSDVLSKYSDLLLSSADTENEHASMYRKLLFILRINDTFLKFIKDTKIWDQLLYSNNINCLLHVILNIERCKISLLFYQTSDNNSIFYKTLTSLKSYDSNILLSPQCIDTILSEFMDSIFFRYQNMVQAMPAQLFRLLNDFLIESFEIFRFTQTQLHVIQGNLSDINIDNLSLITTSKIKDGYFQYISFGIMYLSQNKLNVYHDNFSKLYMNFFSVLDSFADLKSLPAKNTFIAYYNYLIEKLDSCGFIQEAIDVAVSFKIYDQVIRLCIHHNYFDQLHNYKNKWHDIHFDKKINEWLSNNKRWSILASQVDDQNIDDIMEKVPQLSWTYFIKENDVLNAKHSLKHLADNEKNLFFQKTYCSLYRMLEHCQNSDFDSHISFLLSKIDYQQELSSEDKKKNKLWSFNLNEDSIPLKPLLFKSLFNKNAIINTENILKAFRLVANSGLNDIDELVSLIWASVVLVDPYLRLDDTIMKLSCQQNSFFYQCLSAVFQDGFTGVFYSDSLCSDVNHFLNLYLEESQPQSYYQRMTCIFEIFQDTIMVKE